MTMAYDTPGIYVIRDAGNSPLLKEAYLGDPIKNRAKERKVTPYWVSGDSEEKDTAMFPEAISSINGKPRKNMKDAHKGAAANDNKPSLQIDYDQDKKPDLNPSYDESWRDAGNRYPPAINDNAPAIYIPEGAENAAEGYAEAQDSRWVKKAGKHRSDLLLLHKPTSWTVHDTENDRTYTLAWDFNKTGEYVSRIRSAGQDLYRDLESAVKGTLPKVAANDSIAVLGSGDEGLEGKVIAFFDKKVA